MRTLIRGSNTYGIGDCIGRTDTFILHSCQLPDGKPGIVKVSTSDLHNGALDQEAFVLGMLRDAAAKVQHDEGKGRPRSDLGYPNFFPHVVENFLDEGDSHQRILILSLGHVCAQISELAPLEHLRSREKVRVDPKTSVWILGRLLKLLDFAHRNGIKVPIDGENILLSREHHHVLVFDWSGATFGGALSESEVREQISDVARETILALGGDLDEKTIPGHPDMDTDVYQRHLFGLFENPDKDAFDTHSEFYRMVNSIWVKGFHPFTVINLK